MISHVLKLFLMFRHSKNLACEYIQTREHAELRTWESVDHCSSEGFQQCGPWIWRRKHHHKGNHPEVCGPLKLRYSRVWRRDYHHKDDHVESVQCLYWGITDIRCPLCNLDLLMGEYVWLFTAWFYWNSVEDSIS